MHTSSGKGSVPKIMLLGSSGVGKTSILTRFCDNKFTENYTTTIGIDYRQEEFDIDGKKLKMQLWDTSGQEKYKSIAENYYKNAKGMILVYSVVEKNSFADIEDWLKQIKSKSRKDICLALVGSQIDKPNRFISTAEGQNIAKKYGIGFFETSAKTGENIKDVFRYIAKEIKKNILDHEPEPKNDDEEEEKPIKEKCCQ